MSLGPLSPNGWREPRDPFADAWRALTTLHRRDVAECLLDAAAIVAARHPKHGVWGLFPFARPALRRWRMGAEAVLRRVPNQGLNREPRGLATLRRLVRTDVDGWPRAAHLAADARACRDGERAALAEGFALVLDGDVERACDRFAALLGRGEALRRRTLACEGLALAHARARRFRLAWAAAEEGAEETDARVSVLVHALDLAVRTLRGDRPDRLSAFDGGGRGPGLGLPLERPRPAVSEASAESAESIDRIDRIGRAAARLDLVVDRGAPAFAAALAALRLRATEDGGAGAAYGTSEPMRTSIARARGAATLGLVSGDRAAARFEERASPAELVLGASV